MSKKKDSLKPWLSRPTINRSVTLPLTRPLTQRLSNLNEFHPTELDPYLLFDARDSMIGTLENPTLDLDPSKQDTLDVITATRAGTATYTDFNGNIAQAPANTVRVDQTQGAELTPTKFQNIGYTDFSSGLVLSNFGTGVAPVLSSDALGSPNGTEDAYKIVFNAGSGTTSGNGSEVYFNVSEIEDNIQSTASIFLRGENGGEQLVFRGATNGSYQLVTLTTEWQRFTTTENTSPSGNQKFTFGIRQSVSGHGVINSAATVYAYGPQLEEGTTASSFVENTTGSPKFITGATFGPRVPMILVEPSATNLLTATQEVSSWSSTNVSVTSNTTTAPDGSQTGDTVTRTAGGADVRQTKAVTSGTSYTMSIFAKAETDNQIQLDFSNSRMGADDVEFNTRTGQKVSGSANYSITELSNGWRRYSFTSTCISSGNTGVIIRLENDEPVELWGFQFEEGSVATSYIPHISGSTAQRAADDLVITGSDFSDFYNQSEGTFYVEAQSKESATYQPHYLEAHDASGQNRFAVYTQSVARVFVTANNSVQAHLSLGSYTPNQLQRVAASYKVNDFVGSSNGSSEAGDASGLVPVNPTALAIGRRYADGYHIQGHIKRLIFWPYHSDSL